MDDEGEARKNILSDKIVKEKTMSGSMWWKLSMWWAQETTLLMTEKAKRNRKVEVTQRSCSAPENFDQKRWMVQSR